MAKNIHETAEIEERFIIFAVDKEERNKVAIMEIQDSLNELTELIDTAGGEVVARCVQKRERVHAGHYFGKGKVEELGEMVGIFEATGVVCDDELSPAQLRNLEASLGVKVMDRTMVILDIFAGRAISGEGKIQVELAQLKYRLSRLSGLGTSMSRLGGGIGTRGPGEKKLEIDRRYIKDRITELNKEAKEIRVHRDLLRTQREKKGTPLLSLVGYTNAGKSTIINYLTDAGVLAEDKLFATLDTTTRKVELPNGSEILLTDTVGFIQKLPHHLIQAFRATLEELQYADILLHIVDASNPKREEHIEVVQATLEKLGCQDTPVITIFNKIDREIERPLPKPSETICEVSAMTGAGMEEMLATIEEALKAFRNSMKVLIPYNEGGLVGFIHGKCEILLEEHTADGVLMEIYVDEESKLRLEQYQV